MSFDIKQLVEYDGCMVLCACWSGLGFVRVLKGREPSWKTGINTQLSCKGTAES